MHGELYQSISVSTPNNIVKQLMCDCMKTHSQAWHGVAADLLGLEEARSGSNVRLDKAVELILLLSFLNGDLEVGDTPADTIALNDPLKTVRLKMAADGTDVAGALMEIQSNLHC